MSSSTKSLIKIKTTLPKRPFPLNPTRPSIQTPRLIVRALTPDDLNALHHLRSQPEVMIFTALGRPTRDHAETQSNLDRFLAPNDSSTFNFAICTKPSHPNDNGGDEIGTMIGIGGVHEGNYASNEAGWPEVGYMLTKENWGKGYATEFLQGFLDAWWRLEREEVLLDVDRETVVDDLDVEAAEGGEQVRVVPEQLVAVVLMSNVKSIGVIRKCGFRKVRTWMEDDGHEGSPGGMAELGVYVVSRPEAQ